MPVAIGDQDFASCSDLLRGQGSLSLQEQYRLSIFCFISFTKYLMNLFEPCHQRQTQKPQCYSLELKCLLLPLYDEIRTHFEQNPETD